ncbi:MAG: hypothetical protein R6U41_07945 [Desulfosalsimonas sp.]|uniref:oxidoreductase n=1 Tax=Desulfosalsimonas sp. TaxID=3073848 RepID=UPI0039711759
MSVLFQPGKIGKLEVPNRFVRSATYDGCADKQGRVTSAQVSLFEDLAAGGTGLIVTGIAYAHESGRISAYQNSIAEDSCIDGLQQLTAAVHAKGAKIAVQLFHAGREAAGFLKTRNQIAAGPSAAEDDPYFKKKYRSLPQNEIQEIAGAFGAATARAKTAGFDAVQLHAAHAYFIAISRPLIREPDLIRRWKSGDFQTPACISCNKCLEALYQGRALHCAAQKRQSRV